MPRVSIIIPCYNRAGHLPGAVESALAQGPDVEVIVIDDGSTDGSADVAASYDKVQIIRTANNGPSAARNAGLSRARGKFVRFLDSDDKLTPNSTAILLAKASNLGAREIAFGDAISAGGGDIRGDTYGFAEFGEIVVPRLAVIGRTMNACLPIYRASALKELGGFDPDLRISEDLELACRMVARGFTFIHVPAAIYEVGHHMGDRLSRNYGKSGYHGQLKSLQCCRAALVEADPPLGRPEWRSFGALAWRLGRAASREGLRDEATALFEFASSASSQAATSAPWPLRWSYHLMAPYAAERLWDSAMALAGRRN